MYRPQPLQYPQGRSRGHGRTRSASGMRLRACRACRSSPAVGAPGRRRAVSSSSVWLRRPKRGPCVAPGRIPSGNTSGCPEKPVDQQLHAHRPGRELQRLGRQHRPAGRRCAVKTCNFLIRLCAAAQQAGRRTSSARPSPHTPARRLPAGAARKAAGSAGAAGRTEPKSSAAAARGSGARRSAARAGGGGCELRSPPSRRPARATKPSSRSPFSRSTTPRSATTADSLEAAAMRKPLRWVHRFTQLVQRG